MAIFDRRTARILFTILLFGVVTAVVYAIRGVIVIFIFAILFSYLIDPIVRFVQGHSFFLRNLRGPHVLEVYVALLILIAVVLHVVAPGSLGRTGRLFRKIPTLADELSSGEIAGELGGKFGWKETQITQLRSFLMNHRENIQELSRRLEQTAPAVIGSLFVIPILAIFFLIDGANLADSVIRLVSSGDNENSLRSLADDLNTMLKHYIRAKVILGVSSFLFYSVTTLLLGFPHAIALSLLGGILEFIPVVGWMTSAAVIISVGALTHSHWIWMAALIGIWRIVMDYWISPFVMGHQLEIHPLLAIFAVMAGGAIGGIVGIYLSVPLIAVLRVLWSRSIEPRAYSGPAPRG